MAAQIKVLPTNAGDRKEMLDTLSILRARVEAGHLRAIVAVEVRADLAEPTMLHSAGDIHYAEVIGYLEMTKQDLWAKAAGIIDP